MAKRFWEIDTLRGIAIIAMIGFHFAFDLKYFAGINLMPGGLWLWLPLAIGALFIFLAGISLNFSRQDPMKRGAKIFGWGMMITAITWLAFPQSTIWFGILHLIGLGIIVSQLFRKKYTLAAAIAFLAVGVWLQSMAFDFPWLLWLGLQPEAFYTFDYYPLFPWLGVMLLGSFVGRKLYAEKRLFNLPELDITPLIFLGRHSLFIYLLHQPILVALVVALTI